MVATNKQKALALRVTDIAVRRREDNQALLRATAPVVPPAPAPERASKVLWLVEDSTRCDGTSCATWTRIGTATENRDGSHTVTLTQDLRQGAKLHLRNPAPVVGKPLVSAE